MNYRRRLVKLVTFLGGIYFFLEFILPAKVGGIEIDRYHEQITLALMAVGGMAVGLGLINLLQIHGSRIIFRRRGMQNSAALLLGLAAMMTVTIADWAATAGDGGWVRQIYMLRDFAGVIAEDLRAGKAEVNPAVRAAKLEAALDGALARIDLRMEAALAAAAHDEAAYAKIAAARTDIQEQARAVRDHLADLQGGADAAALEALAGVLGRLAARFAELQDAAYQLSPTKHAYNFLFEGLFVPLGAAMFSLLGFYMAAAAYRAFRLRSVESGLMMGAAVVVMLGQIPFGLWIWEGFPEVRLWLLTVPNTAAFRGIAVGASVAGLVMALRMWLSIESQSFSGRSEGAP